MPRTRIGARTDVHAAQARAAAYPPAVTAAALESFGTILAHWDAADLSATAVSSWPSRVGGWAPGNGTAASQPQLVTSGGTPVPAVLYDGADFLAQTASINIGQAVPGLTSFVVMSHNNAADYVGTQQLWFLTTGTNTTSARFSHTLVDNKMSVGGRRLDTDSNVVVTSPDRLTRFVRYVTAARTNHATAQAAAFVNGVKTVEATFQTVGTGATSDTASQKQSIGANGSNAQAFAGRIAKVLIYRGALSDTAVADVSTILAA